jgi:hypothetical protein
LVSEPNLRTVELLLFDGEKHRGGAMANIATVATAAFVKPGVPRGQVTAHGLLRAMTRYYGRTYCVPVWSYDDYPNRCIYVQHGEKWSPTGVNSAWERYSPFLSALWVRWYDDGGDHDAIYRFPHHSNNWCRYGFDSVRVSAAESAPSPHLGPGWIQSQPGVWETTLSGSYLAGNDRCDILADDRHPLRSPTTPACGRMFARSHFIWAGAELPSEVEQLAPAFSSGVERVELLWRGRRTQVYRRLNDRWWAWHLDDWDNCVDPEWLASRAARRGPAA